MQPNFYERIPPFSDFSGLTDDQNFYSVPEDWYVVIADIKGSTRAIEQGRYKDVNVLGATCITASLNAIGRRAIPYVFGGDGATLLVPEEWLNAVKSALWAAAELARNSFGMELRVGCVRVSEVKAAKQDVQVGRFRVSPTQNLAMIRGGGLSLAEKWVKDPSLAERYLLRESRALANPGEDPFRGLECRWSPIASRNGVMVSLLVQALGDTGTATATYREVLRGLESILRAEDEIKPLSLDKIEMRWPPRDLSAEVRVRNGRQPLWRRWVYWLLVVVIMGWFHWMYRRRKKTAGFDPHAYMNHLVANADYRKFDDMLRMVLDLTPSQAAEVERLLGNFERQGRLLYGIHTSSAALMTCMVFDYKDQHIHFIDGADGGYAAAARRIKERTKPKP